MDSTYSSKYFEDRESGLNYRELDSIDSNLLRKTDQIIIYTDNRGTEVFLITRSDDVYAYGYNSFGRLGFGHKREIKEPTLIPELSSKSVIDIKCGGGFSVALTQSGQIYTFGCGFDGRTGNGDKDNNRPNEISVDNQLIAAIDCTNSSTYLLTKTGQLFWFGYSLWNESSVLTPKRVVFPIITNIESISCGKDHIFALTDDGKVYSWGNNFIDQLGHNQNTDKPVIIEFNEIIKQVYCGDNHSLVLTTDGKLYSIGSNRLGQLGIGNKTTQKRPQLVLSEQKDICCYGDISMSLGINNKLYIWGDINDGVVSPDISELISFQEVVNTYAKYRSTLKPIKRKSSSYLIGIMNRAFNNPENSDLTFRVKTKGSNTQFKDIYCHKWFIKESSEYFQTMFANDWEENKTNLIKITDYSYEAYYQYIKSIYTDSIDCKDMAVLLEFLSITDHYLDYDKKDKCEEEMKNQMTKYNVCSVYSAAIKYSSNTLRTLAFELMSKHFGKLSETSDHKNMDPIYANEFIKEYEAIQMRNGAAN